MSKLNNKPVRVSDFDDAKPFFKLYYYLFEEINRLANLRLGKILTIIDASISDPQQRKGIKDLIDQVYWFDCYADIIRMLVEFDQEFIQNKLDKEEVESYINPGVPNVGINEFRSYFGKK